MATFSDKDLDDIIEGYSRGDIKFEDAKKAFDVAELEERAERAQKALEGSRKGGKGGWQPFVSVGVTFRRDK